MNEKRSFDWAPLGLLLAGLAAVGLGGFFYIQKLDGVARAEAEENLTTVANSKVQEISEWRRERLQDAAYIRRTPYAARRALTVLGAPKVEANRTIFISWLQVLLLDHNYKRILLLDTNLNLCLAYPEGATPPLSRAVREGAAAALSARKVVAVDLEPGTQDDEVSLSFIVPLMVRPEGAANRVPATIKSEDPLYQSAALMVLQVDPQEFLYPLLRAWPTPSQTAETLLVRREGDEVVFLNELRHRKGSALKLRQPVSTKDLVVGMAARGQTGTVEGVDYRGMRVFAAIRAVPGTPWLLVAKEDEHEVFMALRQQARMIWAGMGVIVLALFLGVRLLGRRRDVDLLRRQLASEKQSREMAERVELLMHNANDIILFTDSKWQILEANARAVESYGYSREELLRFTLRDLCPPDTRGDFDRVTVQLAGGGSARFETVHQRKDGTTFPVESSDKVVDIGGVRYGVAFIRDITERAMREVEIRRLNRLYLIRSQLNQAMVRLHSREEFLREVCGVAVHSGEFKLAWVARHDALTGAITPLVCESEHRELVQQVRHTWKRDQECLCGWAVRDDRPAVVNDLRVASGFQQWQTEVAEAGVRSAAVFPLRLNGEVWGAFGVYAAETDVFQDREVAMLTEVASEISFGLEVLQGEQNRKLAEARLDAFSDLGERLSAAVTARQAAQIIAAVADQLLGYDTFLFNLYAAAEDRVTCLFIEDIVDGQRHEVRPALEVGKPSSLARRVIQDGAQLVLRDQPEVMSSDTVPLGDTQRPSAAILYVPIRYSNEVIGLLSAQSYKVGAYNQKSLETLQALADHSGGALARLKAQEALANSEERFHSVWDNSMDGLRLTDRDGRVLAVNKAYCNLVKLPREKLEGQLFSVAYHGQGPGEGIEQFRERFDQGTIVPRFTAQAHLWNSEVVALEVSSSLIELGGQGKVMLSIFRDTTAQMELETELRHSQKMQGIGQLAGGVAHDFNNILAIIRGNAELLLMDRESFSGDTRESLTHIAGAAERAAALTRQLLIFSSKQLMQLQPVALNELIVNLTRMFKRVIREDIHLECLYGDQLPLVQADAGMMEQVLLNLVVNARDAMPHGGELYIAAERVTVGAAEAERSAEAHVGDFVCLSVRDTGSGIDPEVLPRIFEPFFTTKEMGKGTGLGLATVYGIVKRHKGWVEVSSRVGKGSTFKVFLPALLTNLEAKPVVPAKPVLEGAGETILLVEDEFAVRTIMRRMLETFNYKVLEAASGREAMEVWGLQRDKIALLLTDIIMPEGISGRDLAEKLWAERPDLRVIFMSGYSADIVGKDADFLQRTRSQFIHKPCPADKLMETMRRALDRPPG